jgi:hypothetical protein
MSLDGDDGRHQHSGERPHNMATDHENSSGARGLLSGLT